MFILAIGFVSLSVTACGERAPKSAEVQASVSLPDDVVRPRLRPDGLGTVAGPAGPAAGAATTVVSLGSPARPGLWMETPLTTAEARGQVSYQGAAVDVLLIPIEGPSGAGSRLSLEAMRALGIPLTDLAEVGVTLR